MKRAQASLRKVLADILGDTSGRSIARICRRRAAPRGYRAHWHSRARWCARSRHCCGRGNRRRRNCRARARPTGFGESRRDVVAHPMRHRLRHRAAHGRGRRHGDAGVVGKQDGFEPHHIGRPAAAGRARDRGDRLEHRDDALGHADLAGATARPAGRAPGCARKSGSLRILSTSDTTSSAAAGRGRGSGTSADVGAA